MDADAAQRNAGHDDPALYDSLRSGWLNRRRVDHFDELIQGLAPEVVAEFGSGTGRLLLELASRHPERRFLGVEPVASYVEYGAELIRTSQRDNVSLQRGTGETAAVVLGSSSADMLLTSDVLHHVEVLASVVEQAREVVRPGGTWAFLEPSVLNPKVASYQAFTPGERNFHLRRFMTEARKGGWTVRSRTHRFLVPASVKQPPAWLAALERRLERVPVLAGAIAVELRRT